MRVPLDLKIHLGLGLALLILCVVGAVAYRTTAGLMETADLVARTHEVLAQLEDHRSTLPDADPGVRGDLVARQREEAEALRQRTLAAKVSASRATLVIACGSLLGFVLTGLASWVISRDINARNRAE